MEERRKTLFIPPELHRRFKVACIGQGVTMQDQAEAIVAAWVAEAEVAKDGKRAPPAGRRKARVTTPPRG